MLFSYKLHISQSQHLQKQHGKNGKVSYNFPRLQADFQESLWNTAAPFKAWRKTPTCLMKNLPAGVPLLTPSWSSALSNTHAVYSWILSSGFFCYFSLLPSLLWICALHEGDQEVQVGILGFSPRVVLLNHLPPQGPALSVPITGNGCRRSQGTTSSSFEGSLY